MRKADRIRELELTIVGIQYELEMLKTTFNLILESGMLKPQDLEAGKWYNRKPRDFND